MPSQITSSWVLKITHHSAFALFILRTFYFSNIKQCCSSPFFSSRRAAFNGLRNKKTVKKTTLRDLKRKLFATQELWRYLLFIQRKTVPFQLLTPFSFIWRSLAQIWANQRHRKQNRWSILFVYSKESQLSIILVSK